MLYNPTKKSFPALSVTGRKCSLDCKHCQEVYLKHMIPVTPESLYALCMNDHLKGVLISGGCDSRGKVPLDNFLPIIKKIKEETDLLINVHTGLVNEKEVRTLKKTNIDCVSFDFVIDDNILKNVYNLNRTSRDYIKTMKVLSKYVNVAPHLCIGLNFGKSGKEIEALEVLSEFKIKKLVLLVLKPTKQTEMENVEVDLENVYNVFEKASEFENVSLGCMRPRNEKIEKKAFKLGFDIAKPSFVRGVLKEVCCVF
jgi:uncharacterized radical SAM superfamily protein